MSGEPEAVDNKLRSWYDLNTNLQSDRGGWIGADNMKTIFVAAAIIHDEDRIFATQRGYGDWKDYWEFPGGKIEPGETPEQALVREIREELDTGIKVTEKLATVEYDYPAFHLSMECFLAEVTEGSLVLKEHEAAKWLKKEDLDTVNWLPADQTVVEMLKVSEKKDNKHE